MITTMVVRMMTKREYEDDADGDNNDEQGKRSSHKPPKHGIKLTNHTSQLD